MNTFDITKNYRLKTKEELLALPGASVDNDGDIWINDRFSVPLVMINNLKDVTMNTSNLEIHPKKGLLVILPNQIYWSLLPEILVKL